MTFDDAVALFHSLEFTPLEFETLEQGQLLPKQ